MEIVSLVELTIPELIALLYQDICRKRVGGFLSVACDACAVVTDNNLIGNELSHTWWALAVALLPLHAMPSMPDS